MPDQQSTNTEHQQRIRRFKLPLPEDAQAAVELPDSPVAAAPAELTLSEPTPARETLQIRRVVLPQNPSENSIETVEIRPDQFVRGKKSLRDFAAAQENTLRPPYHKLKSTRRFETFTEAVDFSRRLHPLPREMQSNLQSAHRTWLLTQIRQCSDQEQLSRFAFSLNYKDLALLFPALSSVQANTERDRIISVIMMRASQYLYYQGWITLQYSYPRSTVQKGLAELCQILENQELPHHPHAHQPAKQDRILPLHLEESRFNWHDVPYISEISLPNNRRFIATIVNHLIERQIEPEDFFRKYAIYEDFALGEAILTNYRAEKTSRRSQESGFSARRLWGNK